jgi:hypothetical protein
MASSPHQSTGDINRVTGRENKVRTTRSAPKANNSGNVVIAFNAASVKDVRSPQGLCAADENLVAIRLK